MHTKKTERDRPERKRERMRKEERERERELLKDTVNECIMFSY